MLLLAKIVDGKDSLMNADKILIFKVCVAALWANEKEDFKYQILEK